MKVRFKVSSLKFVRFFVESGDFIGSRKSEKLKRALKVKRPSRSTRRVVLLILFGVRVPYVNMLKGGTPGLQWTFFSFHWCHAISTIFRLN